MSVGWGHRGSQSVWDGDTEAVNESEMGTQRQSMSLRWGDRGSQ